MSLKSFSKVLLTDTMWGVWRCSSLVDPKTICPKGYDKKNALNDEHRKTLYFFRKGQPKIVWPWVTWIIKVIWCLHRSTAFNAGVIHKTRGSSWSYIVFWKFPNIFHCQEFGVGNSCLIELPRVTNYLVSININFIITVKIRIKEIVHYKFIVL